MATDQAAAYILALKVARPCRIGFKKSKILGHKIVPQNLPSYVKVRLKKALGLQKGELVANVVQNDTLKTGASENPFPSPVVCRSVKTRLPRNPHFYPNKKDSFCCFDPFFMKTPRNCRIARIFCV